MPNRFTFTAGNNLTAAQLNTNVMDGIPFRQIYGQVPSVTASTAITWPVSFTTGVTPTVVCSVASNANTTTSATFGGATATGVTFYLWTGTTANAVSRTVHYVATQMTSTSGTGNS